MGLEDWVDANFCGNWDHKYAMDDPTTAQSRSGYAIRYCGCPILWRSKLQNEVVLLTTAEAMVMVRWTKKKMLWNHVMRLRYCSYT
jgi:hypothetical protein